MSIEILCATCNKKMRLADCNIDSRHNIIIAIDPCKECTEAAEDKGYEQGLIKGTSQ